MTSSAMWVGILAAACMVLGWWDLVDFVLDRVGPQPSQPIADWPHQRPATGRSITGNVVPMERRRGGKRREGWVSSGVVVGLRV